MHNKPSDPVYFASANIQVLSNFFRATARVTRSFQGNFSLASADESAQVQVPDSLICAWLHLVMALAQSTQKSIEWAGNIETADTLVMKGTREIMESLQAKSLLQAAVVHPIALLSLISWNLFQDSIGIEQGLGEVYYQYVKQLVRQYITHSSAFRSYLTVFIGQENEIYDNPNISHKYRLNQLRKELDIIRRITETQQQVICGIVPPRSRSNYVNQTQAEQRIFEKKAIENELERSHYLQPRMAKARPDNSYNIPVSYHGMDIVASSHNSDEFAKLSPTDLGGFSQFFVTECSSLLERRRNEFESFMIESELLDEFVRFSFVRYLNSS